MTEVADEDGRRYNIPIENKQRRTRVDSTTRRLTHIWRRVPMYASCYCTVVSPYSQTEITYPPALAEGGA
jgi:hypothetical protein